MTRLTPVREAERLDALRNLAIINTEPQAHFDAVCRLARSLFRVPISFIALLDADRQWFKAVCGMQISETPREISLCSRTILLEEPLIVTNAATDPRFSQNPFVKGPYGIRFHAGVPLALEPGLCVGTLCLMDVTPREFTAEQIEQLLDLAEIVVAHLRLHEANHFLANWRGKAEQARRTFDAWFRSKRHPS